MGGEEGNGECGLEKRDVGVRDGTVNIRVASAKQGRKRFEIASHILLLAVVLVRAQCFPELRSFVHCVPQRRSATPFLILLLLLFLVFFLATHKRVTVTQSPDEKQIERMTTNKSYPGDMPVRP